MHPISEILCEVYNSLLSKGEVVFPLGDEQKKKLDSVVKTVNAVYFGIARFPSIKMHAVAYLCFIIKDHPVTDGNKRLAVLWFQIFCNTFELKPSLALSMDVLAVSIEATKEPHDVLLEAILAATFPEEIKRSVTSKRMS